MKVARSFGACILCIMLFARPFVVFSVIDTYIVCMLFAQAGYDLATVALETFTFRWLGLYQRYIHIVFMSVSMLAHITSLSVMFSKYSLPEFMNQKIDGLQQLTLYAYIILTVTGYMSFVVRSIGHVVSRGSHVASETSEPRSPIREVITAPVSSTVTQLVMYLNSVPPTPTPLSRTVEWTLTTSAVWESMEECIICYDAKGNVALVPCDHQHFCLNCVGHFGDCPLCRVEIVGYKVLYYSTSPQRSLTSSAELPNTPSTDSSL